MMRRACVLVLLAASAAAREPDGTLGLIQTPNNGMPALVRAGETFDAVLRQQAALRLTGVDGELAVEWQTLPGGHARGKCLVPAGTPPGCYALEADADRNARAVYVYDAFPDTYAIAHLSDTHIGSGKGERTPEAILGDVLAAVNASGAAFALVTGDLTHGGEPDQFRAFIEALDTCTLPTFVCPGNHDRTALNYERFFGPLVYSFRFGQDGYLSFDTKDFNTADELGTQDADLEILRRAIKPCRWSIGFTHRYEMSMGMRSQLILFVDNPLDVLIFGHWHRANTEDEERVPWGTTHITVVPAAVNGSMRLIDVGPPGFQFREPERVAKLR
ncbi:MAG: Metallophos protein [Candidatus Hydrogenedentes bacterium]|nr:Metallophos protein [Candidatus Hydrogenedentota bacterium]